MLRCEDFRTRLSVLLSGQRAAPEWAALAWHEHLHTCSECRDLLEAEEALEVLLETLPEPRLPRALCERVLERLAVERTGGVGHAGLDELLDLAEVAAPEDLAGTVLRGLRGHRQAARETGTLDELLGKLPEPSAPAGLAGRMLERLESQRERRPVLRHAGGSGAWLRGPVRWAVAAGVLLSVALGIWRSSLRPDAAGGAPLELARGEREEPQGTENTGLVAEETGAGRGSLPADEPSDELLASLDLLESWEYLTGDDLDQVLTSLDTLDELTLYLAEEELGG